MPRKPWLRLWLLAPLVLSSSATWALQAIEARDGELRDAIVSLKEPTRLRVDGQAISHVVGNIYSSNCAGTTDLKGAAPVNPNGEIVVDCDRAKGEVYLLPLNATAKPVNLFVSTAQATYTLLLRKADVPADTIVIHDPAGQAVRGNAPSSSHHLRALKSMLIAMASARTPADIRTEALGTEVRLWSEASFLLQRRFTGRGLVGEHYVLTNIGAEDMVLAEQEFDKDDGDVLAVAINRHNLHPGERADVYVLRRGVAP